MHFHHPQSFLRRTVRFFRGMRPPPRSPFCPLFILPRFLTLESFSNPLPTLPMVLLLLLLSLHLVWWQVELERDVQVSLTHHMSVMRSIEVSLGKVHCAVHVDFWIDVQASPPPPRFAFVWALGVLVFFRCSGSRMAAERVCLVFGPHMSKVYSPAALSCEKGSIYPKHVCEHNTKPPRDLIHPFCFSLETDRPAGYGMVLCGLARALDWLAEPSPAPPPTLFVSRRSSPCLQSPPLENTQDVVFASLNWTNSSPEEARARAIAGAQGVVGKPLHAPAADATVDRIYIGEYLQEEIEVAVDFHLGKKVGGPFTFSAVVPTKVVDFTCEVSAMPVLALILPSSK